MCVGERESVCVGERECVLCMYCVWCVCVCVSVREICLISDGISGNVGSSHLQSEDVKLTRIPYVLSTVQHSAVHYERTIEFNSRVQHIALFCIVFQCFVFMMYSGLSYLVLH